MHSIRIRPNDLAGLHRRVPKTGDVPAAAARAKRELVLFEPAGPDNHPSGVAESGTGASNREIRVGIGVGERSEKRWDILPISHREELHAGRGLEEKVARSV